MEMCCLGQGFNPAPTQSASHTLRVLRLLIGPTYPKTGVFFLLRTMMKTALPIIRQIRTARPH
jgi:hypothetical protein